MHSHIGKVLAWKLDELHKMVADGYGCTECDETFDKPPRDDVIETKHEHQEYVDGCFSCKIRTIEMGTGDAGRADAMPQKKWDKELNFYREARSQGIQPEGTSTEKIQQAIDASDKLGKGFDAGTMGKAKNVTTTLAQGIKEMGL